MARIMVVLGVLAAAAAVSAAVFAHGSEAAAAAVAIQRTFVSTSGSDASPCTAAEPCRTFQAALANTLAGGEVVALDSGGYGPFTVDKSVTVAGGPGAHVAITVFTGDGIVVNAGFTDTVVLRNLYLTGLGGNRGIVFQTGGGLELESVVVGGFAQQGMLVSDGNYLLVRDSSFRRNGAEGVLVDPPLNLEISDSSADRNGASGFSLLHGVSGSIVRTSSTNNAINGFDLRGGAFVSLSDSVAHNNAQNGVELTGDTTTVNVTSSVLSRNFSSGLKTSVGLAFEFPRARISASTVSGNVVGVNNDFGVVETYGDNLIRGNTTNLDGTITPVGKS